MDIAISQTIFILHAFVTSAMFGIIWLVQLVHYPMLLGLEQTEFKTWHEFHGNRISYVVAPLMIFELGASLVLVFYQSSAVNISVASLTLAIWICTFAISVPLHNKLSASGFDRITLEKLTKTNWLRTLLYSIKIVLMIATVLGATI